MPVTLVFDCTRETMPDGNPFFIETPWGTPYAVSIADELHRNTLIEEALNRVNDPLELKDMVRDILQCPDLSKWKWPDEDGGVTP